MAATHTIETRPLRPLFLSYLFPSLVGMMLMSVNILVDGIFVSQGIGPTALAGINIAVPIFSILLSISLWIGMGGATLYSIALGKSDEEKAKKIFTLSFLSMLVITTAIIVIFLWKMEDIAFLFGANEQTYPFVKDYLFIILAFGIIYTIENLLSIFIRNDGNPKLAMMGLVVTSVINIILNYFFIFVWKQGVQGVALATILSTVVGTMLLCLHFFRKDSRLKFVRNFYNRKDLLKIFGIGLPSFIVEASIAVMIVLYNITFLYYLGTEGVTAYAMVNYIHAVLIMVFYGIGMALQPLTSYHHGAKLLERLNGLLKIGIATGVIAGVVISALALIFPGPIMGMFGGEDASGRALAESGFAYYAIGYIFLGINMVLAEYYQSIEKIRLATMITLVRSILLFIPLLVILPMTLGADLIWWVFPITEGITTILIVAFLYPKYRKNKIKLMNAEIPFVLDKPEVVVK